MEIDIPLFEMCDWEGKEIPSKEEIDQLELKIKIYEGGKTGSCKNCYLSGRKKRQHIKKNQSSGRGCKSSIGYRVAVYNTMLEGF